MALRRFFRRPGAQPDNAPALDTLEQRLERHRRAFASASSAAGLPLVGHGNMAMYGGDTSQSLERWRTQGIKSLPDEVAAPDGACAP